MTTEQHGSKTERIEELEREYGFVRQQFRLSNVFKPGHFDLERRLSELAAELSRLRNEGGDSMTEEGRGAMAVCRFCGTIPSGDDEAVCCDRNTALKCSWLTGRERLAVIDRQLRYLESCNAQLRGGEIADLRAERDRLAASFPNYTPSPLTSVEAGRGECEGLERAARLLLDAETICHAVSNRGPGQPTYHNMAEVFRQAREQCRAALSQGNGGEAGDVDDRVIAFATAVLHGDDEHKTWLLEAAYAFVLGKPLPAPRGKGTAAPPSPPEGVREALEARKAISRRLDEFTRQAQEASVDTNGADRDRSRWTFRNWRCVDVDELIELAAKALELTTTSSRGLVDAAEWQPIETAPDWKPILLYDAEADHIYIGYWGHSTKQWVDNVSEHPLRCVSLWRELPSYPKGLGR